MATSLTAPVKNREYLKFRSPAGFRDELVYGRIIVSPEPKVLHFQIADNLYKLLSSVVSDEYRVAQRINLRFSGANSMPSPDVVVLSMDDYKAALQSNTYPDGKQAVLAVEVVSPSNLKKHIALKVDLYRQYSIEAWVVDPKTRQITVHRSDRHSTYSLADHIPAFVNSPQYRQDCPVQLVFAELA